MSITGKIALLNLKINLEKYEHSRQVEDLNPDRFIMRNLISLYTVINCNKRYGGCPIALWLAVSKDEHYLNIISYIVIVPTVRCLEGGRDLFVLTLFARSY